MKTRQKNKNANFKILYDRIKNELKEREIFRKYKKYRLPVFNITKFTSIDEVNVPSFFFFIQNLLKEVMYLILCGYKNLGEKGGNEGKYEEKSDEGDGGDEEENEEEQNNQKLSK